MLLLSGCGLESFVVLSQPLPDYTVNISDLFRFTKKAENSEAEFLGFELYYKIYGIDPAESIDNDIGTFDELGPRGFRRINNFATDQYPIYHRPLIDMSDPFDANRSAEFEITIDFAVDLTNAVVSVDYPKIYPDASAPNPDAIRINAIRRDVPYESPYQNEFKRFSADSKPELDVYKITDGDLSPAAWNSINTPPNTIRIALYVLSYGFDPATSSVLYSIPVYLGYLDNVTLPPP